ncbi:MAG: ABC transporter ATP-binding protein [Flavobacteriales bacterium]|nr:ABC transporter ATP-binding protein [Flavobacteriales bacterium]
MNSWKDVYKYAFKYRKLALITILGNLLFTIFNLLSLVLFIPFLQLIFRVNDFKVVVEKPVYSGEISSIGSYVAEFYNYHMHLMVSSDPRQALLFVCVSVFIAFLLKNASRYLAVWYQSELRMAVVRDVRDDLFKKSMELPLSFHSQERKGDLMARLNSDVGEIENGVVGFLELVFRDPIAIIIHVFSLFYISPSLTLISFFLLPITAFVVSRIGKSLKKTAKNSQEKLGLLYSIMDESLSGVRIINKTFRKKDVSPLISETLGAGVMMCLVWFGGNLILEGSSNGDGLTGELFITFIIIFSQLLRPIQSIANQVAVLQKARVSLDRVNDILSIKDPVLEPESPEEFYDFTSEILFKNVSFKYGEEFVIKDVSLSIPKGHTVALVGESGSGKSTLTDLLARFYDVVEGEISIDGKNIKSFRSFDLRNKIGIVSQDSILFNGSVLENIAFGDENPSLKKAVEAAKTANAHAFITELEMGFDSNIGERGNKLSGGQRQRLCIARAVYKNPDILILDEATSALDTESEKLVQEALDRLMKNRTTLIVAHRLSTIRNANNIVVLSKGSVVEQGTHEELFQMKGSYFNFCSLQGIIS